MFVLFRPKMLRVLDLLRAFFSFLEDDLSPSSRYLGLWILQR